jgi:hypothetical protein
VGSDDAPSEDQGSSDTTAGNASTSGGGSTQSSRPSSEWGIAGKIGAVFTPAAALVATTLFTDLTWPWRVGVTAILALGCAAPFLPVSFIWRLATAGLALVLSIVCLLWYFVGRPPSVIELTGLYDERDGDKCYSGLDESGTLTILNDKETWDFVSCQYEPGSPASAPASRTYRFGLPEKYEGLQVVGFDGIFGVDEEEGADIKLNHDGARATWTISVLDRELCSVEASWQSPGECKMNGTYTVQSGQTLVITEQLIDRGANTDTRLWLGVANPRLELRS